ncbi:acyltransferase family protein [Persicitalea jodogahamensis]|uniref:Acyltransferase n=1 Tax=Persicitalea jodogahamensis TaxID=402147 RepID=A0A8J3D6X2_9BACT|nr:acyltransferase [Persicitalea jodogahamensis]GHB69575.1 acyltransferase [Persicitalea jodogahamensis]
MLGLREYIPALTGLRAVAAWLVFIHHFNPFLKGSFLFGLAQQGYTGVSLFFVLSGFLLSYRYYDTRLSSWQGLSDYFRRRIVRIFPLLFLVVTGTFLALYFLGRLEYEQPFKEYILNITLLKGFSDQHKFSGVAQTWSLTVEEIFYLLLPAILLLHRRFHWFFITLCLIAAMGYFLYLWGADTGRFLENIPFLVHYTFWGHCWDFFSGFGLFLCFRKERVPTFTFPALTYTGLILYGTVLFMMTSAYLADRDSWNNSLFWSHFVMPISFATLMTGLIIEDSPLKKLLASTVMQELGKSSYAFYLLHLGLFSFLYKWLGWTGYFLFIALVSWLVYKYLENPVAAFFKGKLTRYQPRSS